LQQKKTAVKPAAPKLSDDSEESPAKKRRRSNPSSPVANRSNHTNNNNNDDFASKPDYLSPVPRARAARAVIDRPDICLKPETHELDVSTITETLKSKKIKASSSKFGFIGLGIMGSGIVKNLINSGHDVCVYNRTHDKTDKFAKAGAKVMLTPSDVIEHADITFSCVSDPDALKNVSWTEKKLELN
jgi:3-hydroxyisobutyrate dehydrogenase